MEKAQIQRWYSINNTRSHRADHWKINFSSTNQGKSIHIAKAVCTSRGGPVYELLFHTAVLITSKKSAFVLCPHQRRWGYFTRQGTATTEQAWKWHGVQDRWSSTAVCSWHHKWIQQVTQLHKGQSIPTISLHEATANFNFVSGLYKLLWNVDKKAIKSQSDGRFTACGIALVSQYPKNKAQIQARLCLS